jgi:HSP20 family protein
MPGLILWKNREMDRLRRDMDRLLDRLWDDFCVPLFPRVPRELPFIDLSETEDFLLVKAEMPGVRPEDMEISITDDRLTVKGEMKQNLVDDEEGYQRRERRYGSFTRTIQLPCRVHIDDVEATYKNGILNILMPKCKPESAREVKIKVT